MAVTLTPYDAASAPKIPSTPDTISLAHARATKDMIVAAAPPSMYGLRLPHDIRQLSLMIPT